VTRGELVTVALRGDFVKPRPALVIQSDLFLEAHATVTVLLLSSHLVSAPIFRITLDPTAENGLSQISQIQVDKAMTIRRDRLGPVIGRVPADTMLRVTRALAVWVGIGQSVR